MATAERNTVLRVGEGLSLASGLRTGLVHCIRKDRVADEAAGHIASLIASAVKQSAGKRGAE